MMDIKKQEEKDTERIKKLWKTCFSDDDLYIDTFFDTVYDRNSSLSVYENGEIASFMTILPKTLYINGKIMRAAYFGGVCTAPGFRLRHFAADMIAAALSISKEQGFEISYLIPFRCDFYRKFGFDLKSYLCVLEGDTKELLPYKTDFREKERFLEIYEAFCQGRPLYEKRDGSDFDLTRTFMKIRGGTAFCSENGYMFYSLKDGVLEAEEIAYKNGRGFFEMLSFIIESGVERFKLRGAFDMCDKLCETSVSVRLLPCAMVYGDVNLTRNTGNYINMPIWN